MKIIGYSFLFILSSFLSYHGTFKHDISDKNVAYSAQKWEVTGTINLTLNDVLTNWYTLAGHIENQYINTATWQYYDDEMAEMTFRLINLYALPSEEFDFEAPLFEIIFLIDPDDLSLDQNIIVLEVNFSPTGDLEDFYLDDYRTIELTLKHITLIADEIFSISGTLTGRVVHQDYKDFVTNIEEYYDVKAEFNIRKIEYAITY